MATPPALRPYLADLRALLEQDREQTQARILALGREFASIVESSRQSNADDEHDPEGSTIAFERSMTSAHAASAQQHLIEVDRAIARLDEGRYGVCDGCSGPIGTGRLLARPAARTCIECAGR